MWLVLCSALDSFIHKKEIMPHCAGHQPECCPEAARPSKGCCDCCWAPLCCSPPQHPGETAGQWAGCQHACKGGRPSSRQDAATRLSTAKLCETNSCYATAQHGTTAQHASAALSAGPADSAGAAEGSGATLLWAAELGWSSARAWEAGLSRPCSGHHPPL